jgi:type I restriction enzyme M protein
MSSNTSGEGEIRKAMIEGDVVEVMIALPEQLFLNTTIPVCLWFLTNDKTKNGRDRKDETLFIDARNLGTMKTRVLKVLTDKDIQKVQDTVSSWRKGDGYEDIEGFCKSSTTEEIEKNGFVLTPGRYVGFADEEDDGIPFEEKIASLLSQYSKIKDESDNLDNQLSNNLLNLQNKLKNEI